MRTKYFICAILLVNLDKKILSQLILLLNKFFIFFYLKLLINKCFIMFAKKLDKRIQYYYYFLNKLVIC
jgi:hypothetical protein